MRSSDHRPRGEDPALAALDRAATRLLEGPESLVGRDFDPTLLPDELQAVLSGVRAALRDGAGALDRTRTSTRRRLVDALRSEVLREWSGSGAALLALMRAFEVAVGAGDAGREEGGGETLAGTLDPDAKNTLREVAHILRSPMGSLVMIADTLHKERAGPLTAEQKRQIGIIHRAALAVAVTAGDLLTHLGDLDEGEKDGAFRVAEVLDTVADILGPVAEARGCDVIIGEREGQECVGPRIKLTRVLLAITLRAVGMIRDGTLELDCAQERDGVEFRVTARGLEEPDAAPEMLRLFRSDPDSGLPMLSPHGLGFSAAARMLAPLGAELMIETREGDELFVTFPMPLRSRAE